MMLFEKEVAKQIKRICPSAEISLGTPPDPKMGDLAFPCFSLSRILKKAPAVIAADLAGKIKPGRFISGATAEGAYLNFHIRRDVLAGHILGEISSSGAEYGKGRAKRERIMVEFFHANTHKGVHVGHIRNMCLGESLSRILVFSGYRVLRVNYQGDIGAHVTKCLWGLLNFKTKMPAKDRGVWLGEVYSRANKKISGDDALENEIQVMTKKLYSGDPRLTALWKKTRKYCLDDFEDLYREFGVNFDRLFFESEVEKSGVRIAKELLKKKIAKISDGAIVIDLEKYGLAVFIILKSDGTALYSTKDMALAKLKFEKYRIDRSIHVVGKEQEMYFKQLFKTFEMMGFRQAKKSYHLIYDLVMLPEGKMSSREGNVVLYNELRNRLFESASGEVEKRHPDWSKRQKTLAASQIAFGALKFGMLNRENNRIIMFDWDQALDFEGETGPYVQYAHARMCSILRRAGGRIGSIPDFSELSGDAEHSLLKLLMQFPGVAGQSSQQYKPHLVARYALELAQQFNLFYHACPILKEKREKRDARLFLVQCVRQVLESALGLLGIEAPERM
ncbi:MAG: arginine--tRNA ligase [archaeon]